MTKDQALRLALEEIMTKSVCQTARTIAKDALRKALEQPEHHPKDDIATLPEPVAWLHPANASCVTTDPTSYARGIPLYTSPLKRKPLTDVIKAAQGVLEWTEIAHRPPKRDELEGGRMVSVRLHALADLHEALSALGIKGEA